MVKRVASSLLAVLVLAVGVVLAPSAASASPVGKGEMIRVVVHPDGTCGQTFQPSTSGGEAAWSLTCGSGTITIDGWVKDTAADGMCAYVKAFDGNGQRWPGNDPKACPEGTKKTFDWTVSGSTITAYLYVV